MKNESFILKKPIKVRAFNWQQGCRTHWLTKDKFIFNDYDFERNEYCSFVYSLKKGCVEDKIKVPVQDSFSDKYIISICYKKLASLRPDYGYFRHKNENENENENEIGIWKYSFSSKSLELIITIKELLAFEFDLNDKHCKHKVNHVMISPNGEYFIFMHRYYNQSGKRFDRLILADNSGKLLKVIADFGMVSHCFWYDSNTIIGYLRSSEGKDSYWLINIKTAKFSLFKPWEDTNGDGHPSVYNDFILTDTYPDKSRMQTLYLTNKKSNLDISLGEFFHGFKFSNETRCDLHPRFSLCGNFVFFDSVYTGKRQLHYLDISKYKSEL
ncbi:hypothetical protein AYY19_08465 [Photobacterium aquimaris]|nr:hypothetical protein AYY19_08465 [Photobacterium aquimaris]